MKVSTSIYIATAYLLIFIILPVFGGHQHAFYWLMFAFSPFVVITMVLNILMNGKASDKNWEDGYWYEDKEKMETKP